VTEAKRREDEFKRLHASVVEANKRLEDSMAKLKAAQTKLIQTEKLSAMGELISGVAHEINNPLTGIMGYSQLLLESISDPAFRERIERINHEALRCKRIVQNLLGFSRTHRPQKQETDMNKVIRSVIELREYQIRSDGIELVMLFDGLPPRVMGDFHQLQQVILNILNNAHQAIVSSGTGRKIETRASVDMRAGRVCVTVSDDGPGIPEENLPRIFDPFFTTKEHGTGLGLAISYGIVEQHGGTISVESCVGKGSTFTVQLPVRTSESEG
jgi:two-component system NtrC family sensor kinase